MPSLKGLMWKRPSQELSCSFEPWRSPAIKRYALTDEGKKYFRQTPGIFGPTGSFCYGRKAVDLIVK